MAGLVLNLAPGERVLINGVAVENGNRRSRLSILTKNANILRLRDAIHPSEASTPIKRLCYVLQLVISGDIEEEEGSRDVLNRILQLESVQLGHEGNHTLLDAKTLIESRKFYPALKKMKLLIEKEKVLLKT